MDSNVPISQLCEEWDEGREVRVGGGRNIQLEMQSILLSMASHIDGASNPLQPMTVRTWQ